MTYAALHDELENDPLARVYSEMTDSQAADDLNTAYRTQLFESIDQTEYAALT